MFRTQVEPQAAGPLFSNNIDSIITRMKKTLPSLRHFHFQRTNLTGIECTSVITEPKRNKGLICNNINFDPCKRNKSPIRNKILKPSVIKVLSVITFGPKCNKGRICKSYLYKPVIYQQQIMANER